MLRTYLLAILVQMLAVNLLVEFEYLRVTVPRWAHNGDKQLYLYDQRFCRCLGRRQTELAQVIFA
jgi:hypothetical protein